MLRPLWEEGKSSVPNSSELLGEAHRPIEAVQKCIRMSDGVIKVHEGCGQRPQANAGTRPKPVPAPRLTSQGSSWRWRSAFRP